MARCHPIRSDAETQLQDEEAWSPSWYDDNLQQVEYLVYWYQPSTLFVLPDLVVFGMMRGM